MAGEIYKLEGAQELLARLKVLPSKMPKKIFKKALRAGAKIVLAEAKKNAPVKTGALRKSLKVRAGRAGKNRVSMLVSTRRGDFKGNEFYGAFQEFGWKAGKRKGKHGRAFAGDKRKKIEGKHYIERAYDSKKKAATDAVIAELRAGLDAEAAR